MRLDEDIAIVGISVFTPGGTSVGQFWDGISRGQDFITETPPDVMEPYYFEGKPNGIDRFYTSRGGFTPPFKADSLRYGIAPVLAKESDPEQLMSLVGAEHALRDAGVFEKNISLKKGSIIIGKGSFSGSVALRLLEMVRMSRQFTSLLKSALPELTDEDLEILQEAYQRKQGGDVHSDMALGTLPNLGASVVAHHFGIEGPAYIVDGACASGILAIEHSIELLRNGESDIAIAGGMHGGHSPMFWGVFDLLHAMSKKQKIAPFSKEADGLLVGQGYGFVVLKKLRKAIEDGDRIYSIIKDTAMGSDGLAGHVMVTSIDGQVRALSHAWEKSGLDPKDIAYVEAHGTATVLGDRTEIETLKNFFGDNKQPLAYVGSIKSNMGHLMPAAGIIGVIKTALALYHRKIPPTLHCDEPIAAMFESRFRPPQEAIDWDGKELPLVAGVNAFGFGGINTHAILTACETDGPHRPKPYFGEAYLVSAKSKADLIEKIKTGDYTDTGGGYRLAMLNPDQEKLAQAVSIIEQERPWYGESDIWFTSEPLLSEDGKVVALLSGFDDTDDIDYDDLSDYFELPRIADLLLAHEAEIKASDCPKFEKAWKVYAMSWLSNKYLQALGIEVEMHTGHETKKWDAIFSSDKLSPMPPTMVDEMAQLFDYPDGKSEMHVDEHIETLYQEEARFFIQIGLNSLTSLIEEAFAGKAFGTVATHLLDGSAAQQLRGIAARLFVEGCQVNPNFLGVSYIYQVDNSLLIFERGMPPILTEFPELEEIVKKRYGDMAEALGKLDTLSEELNNPIVAAANENMKESVNFQKQLIKLFEQRLHQNPVSKQLERQKPDQKPVQRHQSRKGETFEEILKLTFDEHSYLVDHTIVRQPHYWKVLEDIDPIVPFTMTMELFAEIATKHGAGKKVVKVRNIQALSWILVSSQPLEIQVKGKWLEEDVLKIEFSGFAWGECVLSDAYPEPTEEIVGNFDVGKKIGTASTKELYDNFQFHGPHYHSAISEHTDIYERGLGVLAEKQAGKGSLLDVMAQQLGNYLHLTQSQSPISFPVRLKELLFFDDFQKQDGLFEHTLKITKLNEQLIYGDMILQKAGKPWAVAHDFMCQRIKSEKSIWSVMLRPDRNTLAKEIAPGVYFYHIESEQQAPSGALQNQGILTLSKRYFGVQEREENANLKPELLQQHIISRIAVKDAVRAFIKDDQEKMLYPIEFYCTHDDVGKPLVKGHGEVAKKVDHLHVSLSHKDNQAVAIASHDQVGIDLEKIEEKSEGFMQIAYTEKERMLLKTLNGTEDVIRFWVAKEACAKKTGLGLQGNPKAFEVTHADGDVLTINNKERVRTMKVESNYIVGWTL